MTDERNSGGEGPFCEARDMAGRLFREFGPSEDARNHFRESRIAFLKGMRTLLDQRISHLERSERKGSRVVVD